MKSSELRRIIYLYTAGMDLPPERMSGSDLALKDVAEELSQKWELVPVGVPLSSRSFVQRHLQAIRLGAPSVIVDRMAACPDVRTHLRPGDLAVLADDYAGLALRMGWHDAVFVRHNALHYSYGAVKSSGFQQRLARKYNTWLARRFDTWTSKAAKAVIAPAGTTEVLLRKLVPEANILGWRPRIPRLAGGPLPTRDSSQLTGVFFANFKYAPNFEALKFLCEKLAPALSGGSVRFRVSGPALQERAAEVVIPPNVEFCGFQPDLVQFCASADFGILPLFQGEGILLKTLTVLGYGLPMVATSKSCAGIGVRQGVDAYLADDVDSMVRSIKLLEDRDLRERMGRCAWETAEAFSLSSGIVEAIASTLEAG